MLRSSGWFEHSGSCSLCLGHHTVQKVHHPSPLPLESVAQSPSWQVLPSLIWTPVLSNWQRSHYWPASPFSGCLMQTRWRCTIATFYGLLDSATGGFQLRSPLIGLILNRPGPFQRVCSSCRINLLVNWCWTLYQQGGGCIIACERGQGGKKRQSDPTSLFHYLAHAQQISCRCLPALFFFFFLQCESEKKSFSGQRLSTRRQLSSSSPSSLSP